jgi:hypothetical protein
MVDRIQASYTRVASWSAVGAVAVLLCGIGVFVGWHVDSAIEIMWD